MNSYLLCKYNIKSSLVNSSLILLMRLVCVLSHFSCVQLCVTPWTIACQAPPLSLGFSRQEYWSGLPSPPAGYLLDPGIEPTSSLSPALQAESLLLSGPEKISNAKMPRGNEAQAPQLPRLCAPTTEALEPVFCHQGKQPQWAALEKQWRVALARCN